MGVIKEQRALGACLERTARRVLKVTSPTPPGSNERGALSCLLEVVDEPTGQARSLETPVVFGADGSGSALRQEMASRPGHWPA